jgi:hypothetical protein
MIGRGRKTPNNGRERDQSGDANSDASPPESPLRVAIRVRLLLLLRTGVLRTDAAYAAHYNTD